MSEAIGKLYAAKVQAQRKARAVAHDSVNQHHRYRYTSAEAIIEESKGVLNDCGLAISRLKSSIQNGADGNIKYVSEWILVHEAGGCEQLTAEWPVVPDRGRPLDKAVASADTTTLAYLLRDLLCLPRVEQGTEMDGDDRDEKSNGNGHKEVSQPSQPDPDVEDAIRLNEQETAKECANYKLPFEFCDALGRCGKLPAYAQKRVSKVVLDSWRKHVAGYETTAMFDSAIAAATKCPQPYMDDFKLAIKHAMEGRKFVYDKVTKKVVDPHANDKEPVSYAVLGKIDDKCKAMEMSEDDLRSVIEKTFGVRISPINPETMQKNLNAKQGIVLLAELDKMAAAAPAV